MAKPPEPVATIGAACYMRRMKRFYPVVILTIMALSPLNALGRDPALSPPVITELGNQIRVAIIDVVNTSLPGSEIELDPQAVRYLLQPIADQLGASFDLFLNEVQFVRLKSHGKYSDLTVELNRDVTIQISEEQAAKDFQLYSVRFPKESRFRIQMANGKFVLTPYSKLVFSVKIPAISDHVYFRKIAIDIETGHAEIRAGILDNIVEIAATAELYNQKFDGIDYGASILDNTALWLGAPLLLGILF